MTNMRLTATALPVPSTEAGTPMRTSFRRNAGSGTIRPGWMRTPRTPDSMIAIPMTDASARENTVA